ncbi:MAG: tetratricopeptide repeat protein [Myxococcales bacterium]|nr:tetratricopeptide repeat protein [Myxococcales bacterium]MCB9756104.1 tetratricopeptide repeat protein [Myxococcales bacterium]
MARFPQRPQLSEGPGLLAVVRAAVVLALSLALVGTVVRYGFIAYTDLGAPDVDIPEAELLVDRAGRTVHYGASSLTRRNGLWHLHLEGPPEAIGAAHGALAGRLFYQIDEHLRELARKRYGGGVIDTWTASAALRWQYHDADKALADTRRRELAAMARTLPVAEGTRLSAYHRLFLYQCFDEFGHAYDDITVEGAMFAIGPRRGSNQAEGRANLLIGRSLSVELGRRFELPRVVSFYYPDGKYPFASVGWPGLAGVVTGINARGVFVALNAARSDEPSEDGSPLALVLRDVLEEADTLERAVEMLKEADLRAAGIVLVGDGYSRQSVIVELSPRDKEERRLVRGEDEPVIWATNHFVRDAFERDAHNDRIRRFTASGYRYDRLGELLEPLDDVGPAELADVLRDKAGLGGEELGLGNYNALENLRLSHAVVVDATAMVMWVAEGPSALGRFRAIDLRYHLEREGARPAPPGDVLADRVLHSEAFRDHQEALDTIDHARALLTRGRPESALASAKIALALAPDLGELHRLLGDIERELDHPEEALKHYRRYLELVPGKLRDQERVRGLIAELGG